MSQMNLKPFRYKVLALMVLMFYQTNLADQYGVIRIGVTPEQNHSALKRKYTPLFEYLSSRLQRPVELVIPKSHLHLLELYRDKAISVAFLDGYSYTLIREQFGSLPIARQKIDVHHTSCAISRGNNNKKTLSDFSGKRIGFGSRHSASSHIMPRFFMKRMDIHPESFYRRVKYLGTHNRVAKHVRENRVTLGFGNCMLFRKMFKNGLLDKRKVQIIWESAPYPNHLWVAQKDIGKTTFGKLRSAFLSLRPDSPENKRVLKFLFAKYFLPASSLDYSLVDLARQEFPIDLRERLRVD